MDRELSTYPGLIEFCLKLYEDQIRSPYLIACMIDTYEEMLELGCNDKNNVLKKVLEVYTMFSFTLLTTELFIAKHVLSWCVFPIVSYCITS